MSWTFFNTRAENLSNKMDLINYPTVSASCAGALTIFETKILNISIRHFNDETSFNLFDIVQNAISPDYVFPSQNGQILESFYDIRDYLLQSRLIIEFHEMTSYGLTESGQILKHFGNIESFLQWSDEQHVRNRIN